MRPEIAALLSAVAGKMSPITMPATIHSTR
jgi:hypothetical protein